jgi:hypothetical protein
MRNIFLFCFMAFLLIAFSGCASHLNQQQCATMNWYERGLADGQAGSNMRNLQQDTIDCAKFQLPINAPNYQKGYKSGLKYFCTFQTGVNFGAQGNQPPAVCQSGPYFKEVLRGWKQGARQFCASPETGYSFGKDGKPYPSACNPAYYPEFKAEYDRGAILYQRISDLQSQIDRMNSTIRDLSYRYSLRYDGGGIYDIGEDRSSDAWDALDQIRHLTRRMDRFNQEIYELKSENA